MGVCSSNLSVPIGTPLDLQAPAHLTILTPVSQGVNLGPEKEETKEIKEMKEKPPEPLPPLSLPSLPSVDLVLPVSRPRRSRPNRWNELNRSIQSTLELDPEEIKICFYNPPLLPDALKTPQEMVQWVHQRPFEWSTQPGVSKLVQKAIQHLWDRIPRSLDGLPKLTQYQTTYGQTHRSQLSILQALHNFFARECPIVIIVHGKILKTLTEDGYYRNQFETNTSSGTLSRVTRTQWEDRLFDSQYSGATDFERVKYGCYYVSVGKRPEAMISTGYGDCYLVLKDEVRSRCTFSHGDSGGVNVSVSMVAHPVPYLLSLSQEGLNEILERVLNQKPMGTSYAGYLECQIHGEVDLSRDVKEVWIPDNLPQHLTTVTPWKEKWGVPALQIPARW